MKFQPSVRGKVLAAGLLLVLVTAVLAQANLSLVVNGVTASTNVRMIGGQPYVPLRDVAKAYSQTLVKKPGGYELIAAGGAGEVGDAHTARIGQELFTGQFRFKVTGIRQAREYTTRFSQDRQTVTAEPGEVLFIADCRIKNGTKQKQELVFSINDLYGNPDTALTDDQEHSYAPLNWHGGAFGGYDVHVDEHSPDGTYVLPGAAVDFAIVFSAPPGTHPTNVVYSILKYGDRSEAKQKSVDVRVSVAGALTGTGAAQPGDDSL